ncbi:MAG: hypothetical protein AAF587_10005 [Bacteroidota bacterium]
MTPRPLPHQVLFENNGFTAELCQEKENLELAYQLRYRAYRHAQAIPENETKLFSDNYDQQSNSQTYLIWHNNVPVASLRICLWSPKYRWEPLEMVCMYPSEIQRNIGLYQIIQESCRFVVDPEIKGRTSLRAQLLMFRIHAIVSQVESSHFIITGVRKKHTPFYQRMLAFDPISEPRYVKWIDEEVVLMATRRDKSYETFLKKGGTPISEADLLRYANLTANLSQPIDSHASLIS